MSGRPYLRVRNWDRFQHYKTREAPWIKLYQSLLDDYEFACLQDASKMHLVGIWLLAARTKNQIPDDKKWISQRINSTDPIDLDELKRLGFLEEFDASKTLAECKQNACLEGEGEGEGETDKNHMSDSPKTGETDPPSKAKKSTQPDPIRERALEVIGRANSELGYRWRTPHKHLKARLRQGATVEECVLVAEHKRAEWEDTEFLVYLHQETLYRASHWERYVTEAESWRDEGKPEFAPEPAQRNNGKPPRDPLTGARLDLGRRS